MDEFLQSSVQFVEFESNLKLSVRSSVRDASSEANQDFQNIDQSTQTNGKNNIGIQTEQFESEHQICNDQAVATWLKKIYPVIAAELLEGVTHVYGSTESSAMNISIKLYQQISREKYLKDRHTNGAGVWLSSRLNNVPNLVISSSPSHRGWCEHFDQKLSLYVPKRIKNQQFVSFVEVSSIPVNACIQLLAANTFDKSIFAGITVANDFHIWKHDYTNNSDVINQIAYKDISTSSIIAIDWLQIDEILTAHVDGVVCSWKISAEIILSSRFKVNTKAPLTKLLAIHPSHFVTGTEKGHLIYCSTMPSTIAERYPDFCEPQQEELEKHSFSVAYLSRGRYNGIDVVISYDLNGELFLHDIMNFEDGPVLLIKLPLPLRNVIDCSKDLQFVISSGNQGSIELFRICDGQKLSTKGNSNCKETLVKLSDNGVLVFPPVNNYRRFLIHKVCEELSTQYDLVTFSIGQGIHRRTVVCFKSQLLVPLDELSGEKNRKETKYKSWRSGGTPESSSKKGTIKMGVDKNPGDGSLKHSKTVDIYRPPALRNEQPSNSSILKSGGDLGALSKSHLKNIENLRDINVQSNLNQIERSARRERRPDRAVYIPKARRSQTTSPHSNISRTNVNEMTSLNRKQENGKSPPLTSSDDLKREPTESGSVISMCDKELASKSEELSLKQQREKNPKNESATSCDSSTIQNIVGMQNINLKTASNSNTSSRTNMNSKNEILKNAPSDGLAMPLIENGAYLRKENESDKEINELERMSKEINRSSRRIVKQTFKSDVLVIPDAVLPIEPHANTGCKTKDVDPENDDWESMFDDNGDCLDPKIVSELTASVGKVTIEQPASDYKVYLLKQAILNEEEYPHVLEISNFPVEFKTQDLMMVFSAYKESGFDIKWVDDTHALAIFSSSRIAAEVLAMGHPFVLLKPLADASVESRTKARKCAASLQPYRARPETCAALARRLVTGALGVRLKTAAEERENEKKILREAKERKLLAAKQRDEAWES